MSFAEELKEKAENARKNLAKKSREEKLKFLITAGIVNKKGELVKKFQPKTIVQRNKKAS